MRKPRFSRLLPAFASIPVLLFAAGCVQVEPEPPYERRTSVWVSDSTTEPRDGSAAADARESLLWPIGTPVPTGPVVAALSFAGADLGAAARADEHVKPISVAIVSGAAVPARRVPVSGGGWDVWEIAAGSNAALAFEGFIAREKPWMLGFSEPAGGGDRLVLRGCADGRAWVRASSWPDPHMSLFLDKLRALCASLAGE